MPLTDILAFEGGALGVETRQGRRGYQSHGQHVFREQQNHLGRVRRVDEMTGSLENQFGSVTLYERLGASAGIRTLVDETVDVLVKNPALKLRFQPFLEREDWLVDIKQQVCVFVSARSGGPDKGQRLSMTEALCRLNISDAEYKAAVEDIIATMAIRGYDDSTRSEVLAILSFMKADIVPA